MTLAGILAFKLWFDQIDGKDPVKLALSSLMVLLMISAMVMVAYIRGIEEYQSVDPVVFYPGAEVVETPPAIVEKKNFWEKTQVWMFLLIFAGTLGGEIISAMLFKQGLEELRETDAREARRLRSLRRRRRELPVLQRSFQSLLTGSMGALQRRAERALNEEYQTTQRRKRIARRIVYVFVAIVLAAIFAAGAFAARARRESTRGDVNSCVAVLLDTSRTSNVPTPDGITMLEQNCNSVGQILVSLPERTEVRVYGIASDSWGSDTRYFTAWTPVKDRMGINLNESRKTIGQKWRGMASKITAESNSTDLFGAFASVSDFLSSSRCEEKSIVVLSDARHTSDIVNLNKLKVIDAEKTLELVRSNDMLLDLTDVSVWFYGVHSDDKKYSYWKSLENFWRKYVTESGGTFEIFTREAYVPSW